MITNFKIFENSNIENVRCNWGYSFFDDNNFEIDDEGDEICPICGNAGILMNVTPFEIDDFDFDDFDNYIENNKPKKDILKTDYSDLEEYYRDAYPEYFAAKKYNL